MGLLITFEGIEGCGKTTQIIMAGEYLEARRIPHVITVEPGATPLGRHIREILLHRADGDPCAEAEALLFTADRAQHTREILRPALAEGLVVLCDRFIDATLAYQGFGRGLDMAFLRSLNDFSSSGLLPDLTFLFDLSVEEGQQRIAARRVQRGARKTEDRIEGEAVAFHRKIREGYLRLAGEEPLRFRIIDAAGAIPVIHREVCSHLQSLLDGG